MREQPRLARQAAAVAGECAILADNAVAGNEDGEAVGTVGGGHGAHGGRVAELFGQRLIMGGFAVGDGLQRVPHPPLKRAAGSMQRHAKLAARALEICAQLGLYQADVFVFALLGLAAEQALEIAQFAVDALTAGKFEQAQAVFASGGKDVAQGRGKDVQIEHGLGVGFR